MKRTLKREWKVLEIVEKEAFKNSILLTAVEISCQVGCVLHV